MTLIITAAANRCVIQLADTRLSRSGRPFDDRLVKATIIHCLNGKLVISYTGLACIDSIRTDLWLTRKLMIAQAWKKTFPEVVEFLRLSLEQAIPKNPYLLLAGCGLTLVISGMALQTDGRCWPAIAEVSNIQKYSNLARSFQSINPAKSFNAAFFDFKESSRYFISLNGAVGKQFTGNSLRRQMAKLIQRASTLEDQIKVGRIMVAMLRQHRAKHSLSNIIGEECTVTVIRRDLCSNSAFFSNNPKSAFRLPNVVRECGALENVIGAFH